MRAAGLNPFYRDIEPALLRTAVVLAGEPAWPADAALTAIQKLAEQGLAVVGVEVWHEDGGRPRWIATSHYRVPKDGGWAAYVDGCAHEAQSVVAQFREDQAALFNLTWIARPEPPSSE